MQRIHAIGLKGEDRATDVPAGDDDREQRRYIYEVVRTDHAERGEEKTDYAGDQCAHVTSRESGPLST